MPKYSIVQTTTITSNVDNLDDVRAVRDMMRDQPDMRKRTCPMCKKVLAISHT